ncbi:uncharacterized protein [Argopecten irradians]|uniref:uncharacterized protein n=1 Tax=Argopecten irradians TaxID=31199 RepID=UPI0037224009
MPLIKSTGTDVALFEFKQNIVRRNDCYLNNYGIWFTIQTHQDLFEVRGSTPQGLYLKSRLDYEKIREYSITVLATLLFEQNDTAEFIINVEDSLTSLTSITKTSTTVLPTEHWLQNH